MHLGSTAAATPTLNPINPNPISIFCCTKSTLLSNNSTKSHLANLERILQKQTATPPSVVPADAAAQIPVHRRANSIDIPLFLHAKQALRNSLSIATSLSKHSSSQEQISPKSLSRRQTNLLSDTSRSSPRERIASKWRQYHGASNWEGLLDPLDANLRRELIRYGEMVQTAYHIFHSNTVDSTKTPRSVTLADKSYRLTRPLFATASVNLPKFVGNLAPSTMFNQQSSLIGYIAVCDSEREIQRMGRRDIVIALRGTSTCLEWAENLRTSLVPVDDPYEDHYHNPKVECGFRSLYKTSTHETQSLSETVVEEVRRLSKKHAGEELSITITGHSLGAALAVLVADELSTCGALPPSSSVAVISFGGPRVGNRDFADRVERRGVKVLRVVNARDVVTRVPGVLMCEEFVQRLPSCHVLKRLVDGYSHVGKELRLDSQMSPYLKPDADPACCHDLESYLHLIDGFLGSEFPFRSNAKRSLGRLLSQQGANVKRLYVSKNPRFEVPEPLIVGQLGRCASGQLASPSSMC